MNGPSVLVQDVLVRGTLARDVLLPALEGLELPMPRRRRWPGLAAALLAFGLHGLALAASLVLAPGAVQMTDFPVYEVDLVAFGPGAGTGHEDGAPADGTPVASPLPKHLETAAVAEPKPTPEIRQREAKPRPVAPAPPKASAPVAVPDPAAPAGASAATPSGETAGASSTTPAEGRSAEGPSGSQDAAGGSLSGNPAGLPQGQGQGLGRGGYGVGQVERPPRLVRKVEPRYPLAARQRQISGKVLVKFLVDPSGHVHEVSVVEAEPEGWFEQSAVQAVSRWEFSPGVLHGRAVSVWMLLPITFALK